MTTSPSIEERVSRLEGAYEHLATKADIADLRVDIARLETRIEGIEGRLLRWLIPTILAGFAGVAALIAALD